MKAFLYFLLLWILVGLTSKAAGNPEWITNLYLVILIAIQRQTENRLVLERMQDG